MPQVVPFVASFIAKAAISVGFSVGAAKATAAIAVNVLALTAANAAVNALTPKPQIGKRTGSEIDWKADTNAPLPFIAGRRAVGGSIVFREAWGRDNSWQSIATVLSAFGPVNAIADVQVERVSTAFSGPNGNAVGEYADYVYWNGRLGANPDTALSIPSGVVWGTPAITGWGASSKLSGLACDMVTLRFDTKNKVLKRGEPEFLRVVQGIRAYDPRLDSTYPGGSGSHRADDVNTWTYTTNPILHALSWCLGYKTNGVAVGGLQLDASEIRIDTFVEAANVSDALGFEASAFYTTADDKYQVVQAFLQAGGAQYITIDGKPACYVRAASRVSLLTLSRNDIVGAVRLDETPSRKERINTIYPRHVSEANDWETVTADPVTRATYVTEDGGVRSTEIEYPFVADKDQAAILAAYDIADAREPYVGAIPVSMWLRDLEPGDAFTINDDDLGLSSQKFVVLSRDTQLEADAVILGVRGETDSKHAWAGGLTGGVPPTVTYPVAPDITAPDAGDWTLSAGPLGTRGPSLYLTGSVQSGAASSMVVEYEVNGSGDWSAWGEFDDETTRVEITGLLASTAYRVGVRYRHGATGELSNRTIYGPETTVANQATDPNVTDLQTDFDNLFVLQSSKSVIDPDLVPAEAQSGTVATDLQIKWTTAYSFSVTASRVYFNRRGTNNGHRADNVSITFTCESDGAAPYYPTFTGAGAWDAGMATTAINTSAWYAVWLISNGTTAAALLSNTENFSSLTLPSGYIYAEHVGYIRTKRLTREPQESAQYGNEFIYTPPSSVAAYPSAVLAPCGNATSGVYEERTIRGTALGASQVRYVAPPTSRSVLIQTMKQGNADILVASTNGYGNRSDASTKPPLVNTAGGSAGQAPIPLAGDSIWVASDQGLTVDIIRMVSARMTLRVS